MNNAAMTYKEECEALRAEVERLKTTPPHKRQDLHCVVSDIADECRELRQQLAASQLEAKRLREALDNHSGNYKLSKAESAVINQLLEQPTSTEALYAYVAHQLHGVACDKGLLRVQVAELTRQRDLAVSELETVATGFDCDNDAHRYGTYCRKCEAEKALAAIKESEA